MIILSRLLSVSTVLLLVVVLLFVVERTKGFLPTTRKSSSTSTTSTRSSIGNTALQLGFLDFGSNTINTPVLHSSFVSSQDAVPEDGVVEDGVADLRSNYVVNSNATIIATTTTDYGSVHDVIHDEGVNVGANSIFSALASSKLGYKFLLGAVACIYGTNFPLGSILDSSLPPSAASSSRFFLAAIALSPFLPKLHKDLIGPCLFGGCFTAMGYISQSLALADTSPATVSFLGAATVIWCPFLEWIVNKKSMSWTDRPQVWIAAFFCLAGVGLLELFDSSGGGSNSIMSLSSVSSSGLMGDSLALLQAIGFGTGIFMSEQMMKKHPDQALPITAVLVAVTAFLSMVWAFSDGWMGNVPGWEAMMLPNILTGNIQDLMPGGVAASGGSVLTPDDPFLLAKAVMWTGIVSTSLNFFLEIFALGQVPPGEASVILATEPLWAAAFASLLLGESMGWNDYAGGFLIVAACVVSGAQATEIHKFLGKSQPLPQLVAVVDENKHDD